MYRNLGLETMKCRTHPIAGTAYVMASDGVRGRGKETL